MASAGWQFWIDRGGTFTDIVARRPDGGLVVHKLLSEHPERYRDAALQGIRDLLGLAADAPLPGECIEAVKMGTTVGTNALLERRGEPTALTITRGFGDVLRIGYQNRPDIFALRIVLPELLHQRVVEVDERLDARGTELRPLDMVAARRDLCQVFDAGIRSLAVVLMHGYRYPAHELQLADLAREIGFTQISLSHRVSPLIKLVSRGDTTVVDAYLSPLLRRYVGQLEEALGGKTRLMFMQSNGGLVDAHLFEGKDCILSGPAGGIVGAVQTCAGAGFHKIIGFDMGGTSTDVAHFDGEYERSGETEIAGVRLRVPMLHIHTVAAGGGSILHFDGSRYRVGPDSAAADPGPASYRRGGPLTVTDCNVMLGRLQKEHFPRVFGPQGNQPLDAAVVEKKFSALAEEIAGATGRPTTPAQVAEGFLAVAVEKMADAIRTITVQRGHDVAEYTLCCFGGAGGQHACRVADALGMARIFIHPLAGVLSAYGMGLAEQRLIRERSVEAALSAALLPELEVGFSDLEAEGRQAITAQGVAENRISAVRRLHLRAAGSDATLAVASGEYGDILAGFEQAHRQRYGFAARGGAPVVAALSVEVIGAAEPVPFAQPPARIRASIADASPAIVYIEGAFRETPLYRREELAPGAPLVGPALIVEATGTNVIEPGWKVEIESGGGLVMTRVAPHARSAAGTAADPVLLEIFNRRFMAIAEEMGYTLQNTSSSVNIKERLDFSCAIFDREGSLIANAPHIPVHLGSMGESVGAVLATYGRELAAGDVYLLNSPYHGGTHLPDITVVTPVFDAGGGSLLFFTASRGHHADIGGITPGSMPPASTCIEEEGCLSPGMKIVSAGRLLEEELRAWLGGGLHPARNIPQNLADLRAQIAANEKGGHEMLALVGQYSLATVQAYMAHVQDNAEESVRRALGRLHGGRFAYVMDDGGEIRVEVTIDHERCCARIDFTGTSGQRANNFNAPLAVTKAAVLYVFRTLVDDDIPLNAGCLRPLEIVVPEGCMLNPRPPAAVVAGNVETSQYVVDALYGALGVLAGSQGTMNNFTFGNGRHQYYETICGGSGAGPGFDGCDAVQTHMTNSRITDPEVLEWRYPVLLEEFSIRRGSGGAGRQRGGDGVVRRTHFLEPMSAAILSSHRTAGPFGLEGGAAGAPGRNRVERADGTVAQLEGRAQADMAPGDVFVVETPGGGGWGKREGS